MPRRAWARLGGRARIIGAAVVSLTLGALGFVPLFEGPGYEMALGAGLVVPGTAAVVAALEQRRAGRQPYDAFARGIQIGLTYALLGFAMALVHGLRAGFCDLEGGAWLYLLGPGVGSALAGVWGSVAGEISARTKLRHAVVLTLGGPVGSALVQVGLFFATPMVFAYDPFVGHFSGALYDTVIDHDALVTYRAASLLTLFACYVAALHLERYAGRVRWRSLGKPGLVAAGGLAAFLSATSVLVGDQLGHWQTSDSIRATLGASLTVGRCQVVYPRHFDDAAAWRMAEDCDAHVAAIAAWLGSRDEQPVTAFVFSNVGQKRYLMGAARTSIAKPWRREIYIHGDTYPHRVMGHELVHVLAGEYGRGPFRIAGSAGGWVPDPGLIEGIAVAAAPRDEALSAEEWAAAMKQIEVLPALDRLFALSFFAGSSSTSYTAAGAFVTYVRAEHGVDAVTRWYGGDTLEQVTGRSLSELEHSWHEQLAKVAITPAALAHAKARFDRPGVFGRRCPHVVDARMGAARDKQGGGDYRGALLGFAGVLALDPGNAHARLETAACYDRLAREDDSAGELDAIVAEQRLNTWARQQALERLGDLALRRGDASTARAFFERSRQLTTNTGRLRTLDIKHHYAEEPLARAALVALLIGTDRRGPDNKEALDRIGVWRAAMPDDGTPDYLMARQHGGGDRYELAAERLDHALERGLSIASVLDETLRLRIEAACALGDGAAATATLARYRRRETVPATRKDIAQRLVTRCTRAR